MYLSELGFHAKVRRVLESGVGRCSICGSRADLVELESVCKLFFVTIRRVPFNNAFMYCRACTNVFSPPFFVPPLDKSPSPAAVCDALCCRFCDRPVEASFKFCPFCRSEL